jgi:hypothetical protein
VTSAELRDVASKSVLLCSSLPLIQAIIFLMRYCFDTSALNRLYQDTDRDSIVTGMLVGASFRISAYNVIEAAKTSDIELRRELVRIMRRLADNKRPLDRPNGLIRAVARAYAGRDGHGDPTMIVNADPNLEGLWIALNDPSLIDDDARTELLKWAKEWEGDYDAIASGARDRFQELFRRRPKQRPRTAAATIKGFMKHRDKIFSNLVAPIYEQETGCRLSRTEYDELIKDPMWALYFAGYAYALHHRSVRADGFSRERNAGGIDLGQAVYLCLCDRFVTDDRPQYRALRPLNRFNIATGHKTEVWTYDGFRNRLLIQGVT